MKIYNETKAMDMNTLTLNIIEEIPTVHNKM